MTRAIRLLTTLAVVAVALVGCAGPVNFLPTVELVSITPESGRLEGGTEVTIRGRNFARLQGDATGPIQDLTVLVCGVPLQALELKVLEQRTVMLPPATHVGISLGNEITGVVGEGTEAGASDVVLVQPGGGRVVLEGAFECVEPRAFAVATAEPNEGTAPLTVEFDASGSSSEAGVITSHAWDFGDGAISDELNPSHTFTDPGTYLVTLSVSDDTGATDRAVIEITARNAAPVAVMSVDPASDTAVAPLQVTLDASESTDVNDDDLTYVWTVDDVVIAETAVATHAFARSGSYRIGLTVTDVHGTADGASLDYVVGNAPPVAAFSTDPNPASGQGPLQVNFHAGASTDPDGSIVLYEWAADDGTSATGVTFSHTFLPGTHNVTLSVTDDEGATDTVSGQVLVDNTAPVAVITTAPSPATGTTPLVVEFSASDSTDPDGTVVGYAWDFGDGTTSDAAKASHTFTAVGDHEVSLVVTDDGGAINRATVVVTVQNSEPVAVLTVNPGSGTAVAPQLVNLDATASSDADGDTMSYEWTIDGVVIANTAVTTHTFARRGTYSIGLTVRDVHGATDTDTLDYVVANAAPTASFVHNLDPQANTAPRSVTFDASGSTDPDGSIASYTWTFGDGGVGVGVSPTYTFAMPGDYVVTLTVTDDEGADDVTSQTLSIVRAAPEAAIGIVRTNGYQVSFSAADSVDADGTIEEYSWDFGDGQVGTGETVTHTYSQSGSYRVVLTVTDDDGLEDSAEVQAAPVNLPPLAMIAKLSHESDSTGLSTILELESLSHDAPGGSIITTEWHYEGNTSSGPLFLHILYGMGPHVITLTVTDNEGATATAVYEFTVPTVLLVDIVETTLYLEPGDTRQLNVNVTTVGGATEEVEWISDDPALVSVDQDGRIEVHGHGHAAIRAVSKHDAGVLTESDQMLVASGGPVPEVAALGTAQREEINDMTLDPAGNIYLAGVVFGTDPAWQDMLLIKLDPSGNELWRRSYGTYGDDQALAIAVHPTTGTITLVGRTDGQLGSDAQVGAWDAVILNLEANGSVAWSRQIGTTGNDFAAAVVLDPAGNVYTTGTLNDSDRYCTSDCSQAFMARHSPAGQLDWFETMGSGNRNVLGAGLTLDHSGHVVVTGMHEGDLGQPARVVDAFIRTLDATDGFEQSLHLFGTDAVDISQEVLAEPGGQYLWLGGDNAGIDPSYVETRVRRLDASTGAITMERHYYAANYPGLHSARELALLASGAYAIAGNWSGSRVFISGHAPGDFAEVWYQQYLGSGRHTTVAGIAATPDGSLIVAGHAMNDADGRAAGNLDPFVLFFRP